MKKLLLSKFKEAALSVLPIIIIVAILNFTVLPCLYNMMLFNKCFVMILGIALFNLGVDVSLMPIGENIGAALVKSKNLIFIIF